MPSGVYPRTKEMKTGKYERTEEMRRNISLAHIGITPSVCFKKGEPRISGPAHYNWKGGISLIKKSNTDKETRGRKKKKTIEELLARKRFRNQRYKAIKRNAIGSHTFKEWLLLKDFYQNMCLCCKRQEPEIKLTEDHIMPLSMGGSDGIENIQPLCQSCNTRKHAKYISYLPSNESLIYKEKVSVN